ncbi:MAG: hypothetical protein IH944_04725 [Armatimonadetes bacterium]|nr:hypothetical protein [Armatimonadota bacterium]
MKHTYTYLVTVALLLGLGCSGKITVDAEAQKFIGTWVGKPEMSDADMAEMRQQTSEENIKFLQEKMVWTVEIYGDGTYQMEIPKIFVEIPPFKDTWSLDGDKLTLASSSASVRWSGSGDDEPGWDDMSNAEITPDNEPMVLRVEANGTELVWIDDANQTTSHVVFRRK